MTSPQSQNSPEKDHETAPRSWRDSAVGERLLTDTQPALQHLVRRFHGDTLLWAGESCSAGVVQRAMVRNRFMLLNEAHAAGSNKLTNTSADDGLEPLEESFVPLHGELAALPMPNNCMDGVVLHHALEPLADPRAALREVARVLHPGGRLLLVGFNPWSLLGLRRFYARLIPDRFSATRFVNPIRLLDWLALLGFELEEPVRYLSYGLPFRREGKKPRQEQSERLAYGKHRAGGVEVPLADVFVVVAVKQAIYMRLPPVETHLVPGKLAGVAYPRAATRTAQLIPLPVSRRKPR